MPVFDDAALAAMRAFNLDNMDATCVVLRTPDGDGVFGSVEGEPVAVFTDLPCRVTPTGGGSGGGNESPMQGANVAVSPWIVNIDGIHAIRALDSIRVQWNDDSVHAGRIETFDIETVEDPASYTIQTVCNCTRAA